MKALVFVFLSMFLLTFSGCSELSEKHRVGKEKEKQKDRFMVLQSGDKFDLADYKYAGLEISYSDSSVLQYRVSDWSWFYKVTVSKKDSVILNTRSYWVKQ